MTLVKTDKTAGSGASTASAALPQGITRSAGPMLRRRSFLVGAGVPAGAAALPRHGPPKEPRPAQAGANSRTPRRVVSSLEG